MTTEPQFQDTGDCGQAAPVWVTASDCSGGSCVQVAHASPCTSGNCVEVAHTGTDEIWVRDSKNPDGAVLRFTRPEWDAFVQGVNAGEFRF